MLCSGSQCHAMAIFLLALGQLPECSAPTLHNDPVFALYVLLLLLLSLLPSHCPRVREIPLDPLRLQLGLRQRPLPRSHRIPLPPLILHLAFHPLHIDLVFLAVPIPEPPPTTLNTTDHLRYKRA